MDLSKHLQKAEDATRRRNYPLAIGLYQQILDLDPDSGQARAGLRKALDKKFEGKRGGGVLAVVQGFLPLVSAGIGKLLKNHGARARSLERFLALAPNHVGGNLALGEALYRAGHNESAYVVYRHLAEKLTGDGRAGPRAEAAAAAWRHAGAIAHERKMLDEAMECYQHALEINPRDQEALRARKNLSAETQLGAGYATASSSRELIKDQGLQQSIERSQRMHKSGDELESELRVAEDRLAAAPQDPRALRAAGELRAQAGDVSGALDCLERALELDPDDAKLMARIGALRIQEIRSQLEKAKLLGDGDKVADLERKAAALELAEARRRVEAHPTDLALRHELGLLLLARGDVDQAIAEFQKAVKDPRLKLEALFHLGRSFRQKGMRDLARTQLEKALEAGGHHHDRSLDLLYELGCLAEEDGESDAARGYFSRIIEADIGYRDAASRLEALSGKTKT